MGYIDWIIIAVSLVVVIACAIYGMEYLVLWYLRNRL
jgi:hypothetical protein